MSPLRNPARSLGLDVLVPSAGGSLAASQRRSSLLLNAAAMPLLALNLLFAFQGNNPASALLTEKGSWVTSLDTQGNLPHELIIDFGEVDCLDEYGNLFTSAWDGVHVYSASARLLGKIRLPEKTANCTFGGAASNRLFITASSSIYAVTINTRGPR